MELFQDFSSDELNDALKQCPSTNFFDPDRFHIQILKKLGNYARTFFWKSSINVGTKRFGYGPNHE